MKKDAIIGILFVVIIILLGCVLGFLIFNNNNESNNDNDNNAGSNEIIKEENTSSDGRFKKEVDTTKNEVNINGDNYNVKLNGHVINVDDIVEFDDDYQNLKYARINVSNVNVNGSTYNIKINIPNNSMCTNSEAAKVIFNNKTLINFDNDLCYLRHINEVFIINNKYVGVLTGANGLMGSNLNIFDSNGNEIYKRLLKEIDLNTYEFTAYDNDNDYYLTEDGVVNENTGNLNKYVLGEKDGVIKSIPVK